MLFVVEFECGHSGWWAAQLGWYMALAAVSLLKMSACMLFNDVPCSLVATNLRHESVTSSSDADRSPRQRLSVNVISLFSTVALPIPMTLSHPLKACAPREFRNTAWLPEHPSIVTLM